MWRVAALLLLVVPAAAEAQALKTARLAGGETRLDGRTLRVTGGFVDPKTGAGRVEHRGRVIRLGRNVRRVETSGLVTRVTARVGDHTARLRLRLAQLVLAGGTTTLTLDPETFEPRDGVFRITGGRLDARSLAGHIANAGVLRVADRVELRDLGLRPGETLSAQVGDVRPDVATLAPALARLRGLRATIGPVAAHLTDEGARGLNEVFETDRFRAGMPFGTVTVRGRLRG